LQNPVITLPDPNSSYVIKLVTYNLADCERDSSFLTIGTQPEILSQVAADDTIGCFGQLFVNFSNTSIGATQHIWDFGDATPLSTAAAPNHLFVNPGLYTVTHIAQSAAGCRDTSFINIKVGKNIQAKYTPSATFGCGTLIVDFVNESQNAVSVKWDFDDGTFAVDPNPQHIFTSRVEPYRVKLFAYNEIGCVDTFIFPTLIQVGTPPVVQFEVDDSLKIIPERTFSFVTLATYPVTFRKWEFGDGNISYEKNPIHEYQFTGKYFVTLTEIDTGGCEETATREVELKDLEGNLWVANAFTPKSGTDKIRSFQPIGYGIEKYRLQVYTSTGKILFESDKLDDQGRPIEGWDGTFKGEEVPQGAYIWSIEAKFLNGTTWKGMPDDKGELKRVGTVILVK
jgi:PKD repeat protein